MHKHRKKDGTEGYEYLKRYQSGFHIEADKVISGISVSVSSVSSIIDFTTEVAVLKMKRGKIRIVGESLSLTIYENKIVEISGKVGNIEFL